MAASERLRADSGGDSQHDAELHRQVGEAANRAIAAGLSLAVIADAEQVGEVRAREELGRDVLRSVERAARRKRDAEQEYAQAVRRAARLGLAHRDIATAGQMARGTIPRDSRAHGDCSRRPRDGKHGWCDRGRRRGGAGDPAS